MTSAPPPLSVGDVVRVSMHHASHEEGKYYFFPGCLGRLIEEKAQGFWLVTIIGMGNVEDHIHGNRIGGGAYGGWWNDGSPAQHQTSVANLKLFARRGGPDDVYPDPLPR